MHRVGRGSVLAFILLVQGCGIDLVRDGGPAPGKVDVSGVPDVVPREEPRSKYGNPESYVVLGKRYHVMDNSRNFVERGIASWYGEKFHGRRTSSGETYDMYALTAAHKTLPLPTYVEVTNLNNGKSVVLRVNDRGPFHENRIIDLSYTAAMRLDIVATGTGLVEVRALDPRSYVAGGGEAPVVVPTVVPGTADFYVQVGAFSVRANAENLRQRLGVLGDVLVSVNEALVDGRTLYRVRIGPLNRTETADKVVLGLARLGIEDHTIVTD